jgi:ATP-dependent exoDNAse (exonuclease V) beta subunit
MPRTERATGMAAPTDGAARTAIVRERTRNVLVVAGAGTGKTNTIIERAVALLAPAQADVASIRIQRMAAITFTRRAAGELRFRLREHLLRELEQAARATPARAAHLRDALANLDAAFVGTIHGFADRLLRLRPVEAALSPAYALVEDTAELLRETFTRLRRAAETDTLRDALGPFAAGVPAALLDEAGPTLRAAARAGLGAERGNTRTPGVASVDDLLERMLETRDVDITLPLIPDPGSDAAVAAADRLAAMTRTMRGTHAGHRRLRRLSAALQRLHTIDDPAQAVRILQEAQRYPALQKERDFHGDSLGWSIYLAVRPESTTPRSLSAQLKGPHRWLAVRLVRLFPVARAMYERVKQEHEVVDYLDLLIKLRNLLRDAPTARRDYQALFDHVFVDEFQDTDPLQCEIIFYLCEAGSAAQDWTEVALAPGKLTVVGDPKQSIYRFRRADIVTYQRAVRSLANSGALEARLETNFRSRPGLIAFFNRHLAAVLGSGTGPAVDADTGRAPYEPLQPAAPALENARPAVHLLPYAGTDETGLLAATGRPIEAEMLAHYVRWLLDSDVRVRDPDSNGERSVRPGDIAVLACATGQLRLLLRQFDLAGIEYVARGGAWFLGHPVVRQYLLALRSLADRDDGVAEAALLHPPFFAIDGADVVAGVVEKHHPASARRQRVKAARDCIARLRARRHERSPGATARDLIEQTALGRTAVTGRNGSQTLATLYEVAAEADRRAAIEGRDYDATTELFRLWAEAPVFLDTPEPIGAGAVHVSTIHGAKGLEFPVVILWDGFQTLTERSGGAWQVARTGGGWAISVGPVSLEHTVDGGLLERERQFGEHERRRLYYVAATRARDLLVLPLPHTRGHRLPYATSVLASDADPATVERFEVFRPHRRPVWAPPIAARAPVPIRADTTLQTEINATMERFAAAARASAQPRAVPLAVTDERAVDDHEGAAPAHIERALQTAERARFGRAFGAVVHRALELTLSAAPSLTPAAAVAVAAQEVRLDDRRTDAVDDVARALVALRAAGIVGQPTVELVTEYPVVIAQPDGSLMSGVIDLLARDARTVWVIDFKTDLPRVGSLRTAQAAYVRQLQAYQTMLEAAGVVGGREVRSGLLFTATGTLHWLE